jgi:NAD dependent epimerase/dehydratase family enzyme
MKWVLGQKSSLVLEGQHVIPRVLLEEDFEFFYPTLNTALEDLFNKK